MLNEGRGPGRGGRSGLRSESLANSSFLCVPEGAQNGPQALDIWLEPQSVNTKKIKILDHLGFPRVLPGTKSSRSCVLSILKVSRGFPRDASHTHTSFEALRHAKMQVKRSAGGNKGLPEHSKNTVNAHEVSTRGLPDTAKHVPVLIQGVQKHVPNHILCAPDMQKTRAIAHPHVSSLRKTCGNYTHI